MLEARVEELLFASACELARRVREREVSVRELVEAHLGRIDAVAALGAVVAQCPGRARREAEIAERAVASGAALGPLHGVPITIKDSLDTEGVVTTWGTPGRARFVPERDASVVSRLRRAGAILLGKTNTPELTLSFETESPLHGRTANPFDPRRSAGGSSGGAAVAVTTGAAALDVGSDTGGSIRVPAHFCGCAGLRPTSGRVPRTGHAIGPGGLADALTTLGPLARRVEDLALALSVLAGPDGHDPFLAPVPLRDPERVSVSGLRVASHVDNGIRTPDLEVAEAVRTAAEALAGFGCEVEERRPPGIEATAELFFGLMGADGGAGLVRSLARAGTPLERSSLARFVSGPGLGAAELEALVARWDGFRLDLCRFSQDFDLLLGPVCAIPACPHGESRAELDAFSYTMTWNLTGWPAAVVRVAETREGLPLGVQLVARPWREDVALAAAGALETALGGWRPPL